MPSLSDLKGLGAIANTVSANTLIGVTVNPDTDPVSQVITGANFANSFNQPSANTLALMPKYTPANSTINVAQGVIFYDDDFIYISTETNNLKRVALSSF